MHYEFISLQPETFCIWNRHFDFKAFDMTGTNAKHVFCSSLERCHSVCIVVVVRQSCWYNSNCPTQLWWYRHTNRHEWDQHL